MISLTAVHDLAHGGQPMAERSLFLDRRHDIPQARDTDIASGQINRWIIVAGDDQPFSLQRLHDLGYPVERRTRSTLGHERVTGPRARPRSTTSRGGNGHIRSAS